jgi:hypothetical protein
VERAGSGSTTGTLAPLFPDPDTMHPTFVSSARRSFGLCSVALLLVISACGGDNGDGTTGEAYPDGAGGQTDAPSSGASSERLELTISGGPYAGTHEITDGVYCAAEPGTWVASVDPFLGDRGLNTLQLNLKGVPVTGGSSTQVGLMAVFGEPETIIAFDGTGTGTARLEGEGAVIELNGTSTDGAAVSVVVQCATLWRPGS